MDQNFFAQMVSGLCTKKESQFVRKVSKLFRVVPK